MREPLFHIAPASAGTNSADAYMPAGFETDAFVHCATRPQVIDVANRLFRGRSDMVLLTIDVERIDAPIRYESLVVERVPDGRAERTLFGGTA